jgi:6-phosphogluconolactonase
VSHRPTVTVLADPAALAVAAADHVAGRIRAGTDGGRRFTFAVSGGRTPWAMLTELAAHDVPWHRVDVFQVDERVAPAGDPDRNLTHLQPLIPVAATLHAMPVEEPDLEAAATRDARDLPERFDLVHLGLGPDGHTASLVPGDPVLEVREADVGLTETYAGRRRMTLTYPGLDRAREVLWLVAGADKVDAVQALLAGDRSIPAARVDAAEQLLLCDRAAAGALATG